MLSVYPERGQAFPDLSLARFLGDPRQQRRIIGLLDIAYMDAVGVAGITRAHLALRENKVTFTLASRFLNRKHVFSIAAVMLPSHGMWRLGSADCLRRTPGRSYFNARLQYTPFQGRQ